MNLLFLDIEWANNKNKSICQLGILIENNESKEQPYLEKEILVNPNDGFDPYCVAVHGITSDKVKNHPTFNAIWNTISDYFYKSVIVGHNVAAADLDGLIKNLNRYNLDIPEFYYVDTLSAAKRYIDPLKVKDYTLESLCKYYEIDYTNHHNALEDAKMTYCLLMCMIDEFKMDINNLVEHYEFETIRSYSAYISSPEIRNNICELFGHVLGFEMDKILPAEEIEYLNRWYEKYKDTTADNGFYSIITILKEILKDNLVTLDEINHFKRVLNTYIQSFKSSEVTIGTQVLKNIVLGIKEDGKVVDKEIYELQKWLYENDYLKNNYPYDTICEIINKIIEDGIISEEEKRDVIDTIDKLYNPLTKIESQIIEFSSKSFCLSGDFKYGPKSLVGEYIKNKGGFIHDNVKKTTDYVVVGEFGSMAYSNGNYGSKVKKAKEFGILVIKEEQLFI